jgi:uncharacterized protein with LGFP repeats
MSKIDEKYANMGGPGSVLGSPIDAEVVCANSSWTKRDYQHGSIYYFANSTGAHEIHGAIAQKYYALKAEASFLGYPQSDETQRFDGFGRVNFFDNGAIYWRLSTGAFEVHGGISARFQALGGPQGVLGYPLSDEGDASDKTGRWNQFENGVIFWKDTNSLGAHEVHGAILTKWKSLGMQAGSLGYPVTNEMPIASPAGGRQSRFEHGTILWTAAGGAKVL